MPKFNVGDKVWLNSGSPEMIVIAIGFEDGTIATCWATEGRTVTFGRFTPDMLSEEPRIAA